MGSYILIFVDIFVLSALVVIGLACLYCWLSQKKFKGLPTWVKFITTDRSGVCFGWDKKPWLDKTTGQYKRARTNDKNLVLTDRNSAYKKCSIYERF